VLFDRPSVYTDLDAMVASVDAFMVVTAKGL